MKPFIVTNNLYLQDKIIFNVKGQKRIKYKKTKVFCYKKKNKL